MKTNRQLFLSILASFFIAVIGLAVLSRAVVLPAPQTVASYQAPALPTTAPASPLTDPSAAETVAGPAHEPSFEPPTPDESVGPSDQPDDVSQAAPASVPTLSNDNAIPPG